jgi:hypothetical protein
VTPLLEVPSCVLSPTLTVGLQPPGIEMSPSFTTVLFAIKPTWTLENAIPQQALVMTTLLVTVR